LLAFHPQPTQQHRDHYRRGNMPARRSPPGLSLVTAVKTPCAGRIKMPVTTPGRYRCVQCQHGVVARPANARTP
jgi:hypothetical protein